MVAIMLTHANLYWLDLVSVLTACRCVRLTLRRVHMDTAKQIECTFNPVCKRSHESA